MSKGYVVRHSYEYVVTHSMPCEVCSVLFPESDLKEKSSYVYGEGWLKMKQACRACFEAEKAKWQAKRKDHPEQF